MSRRPSGTRASPRRGRSVASPAAALALALSLPGCTYGWIYTYEVEVAAGVTLEDRHHVILAAAHLGPPGEEPGPGAATVRAAEAEVRYRIGDLKGEREVEGYGGTCCAEVERVAFFAFVDLDRNERWDTGEPWGADPNNPVTVTDDSYVASIVIAQDRLLTDVAP